MSQEWMPQRGSLVTECLRVMRMRIDAGDWSGNLPGERRLAEMLQVGRDTIRLALAELEVEGWIESAASGRRRKIIRNRPSTDEAKRSLSIGMLSNFRLERLNQPMLLEVDQVRRSLAERSGSIEVFSPGWYDSAKPEKRLSELIDTEKRSAWILHRASEKIQRWFLENRIPCLVRGTPVEGIKLPFLDVDWRATARHAAGQLWRLGHRRIGLITPTDRLRGVEAALCGASELGEEGFEVIELSEDGSTQGLQNRFNRAMSLSQPPTGLIATRPRQVATVLSCAANLGIRVPQQLSLISLARENFLEYLVPEIAGYRINAASVAKQVVRRLEQLVAGNLNPSGNPWLEPEIVKGASTAKLS